MLHKKAGGEDTQCCVGCIGQSPVMYSYICIALLIHTVATHTHTHVTLTSNQSLPQPVIHIPCTHLTQHKSKITGKSQRAGIKVCTISAIITSSVIHTNHSHACKYTPHIHIHTHTHRARHFVPRWSADTQLQPLQSYLSTISGDFCSFVSAIYALGGRGAQTKAFVCLRACVCMCACVSVYGTTAAQRRGMNERRLSFKERIAFFSHRHH